MSRHSGPNRRPDSALSTSAVPAVLPEVVVTMDDTGQARIVVDGNDRGRIEHVGTSFHRRELGTVLAAVATQVRSPIRVEVREADGSCYADILQPRTAEPGAADDEAASITAKKGPMLRGEGFLPGEPILVAVVTTRIAADADGTVRLPIPSGAPRRVEELILFGTGSGTIVRGTAPARSSRRWRR